MTLEKTAMKPIQVSPFHTHKHTWDISLKIRQGRCVSNKILINALSNSLNDRLHGWAAQQVDFKERQLCRTVAVRSLYAIQNPGDPTSFPIQTSPQGFYLSNFKVGLRIMKILEQSKRAHSNIHIAIVCNVWMMLRIQKCMWTKSQRLRFEYDQLSKRTTCMPITI